MTGVPAPSPFEKHSPGVWLGTSWLRFSGLTLQTRMVVMDTGAGLTDAVECIHPQRHLAGRPPGRALTWLMKGMGFSYGKPVMSPEHHALCIDPGALESSLQTLMSWDFDSLVISHGSLLFGDDARGAVESSFTRTLAAARKRNWVGRALRRSVSRWA